MLDTVLSCSHVTKRFVSRGKSTDVLGDISLSVHSGRIVVIRGRSGTGKSTLLQILAGLDHPTTGHVEIAGQPIEKLDAGELAQLRRQVTGFVFQNFNLIPSWTAAQNVEAALIHTPLTHSERRQKVCDMLGRLELGDRTDYLPSELSVGQQQRVAVGRALIHAPALLFADEPTGDVDPETGQAIMDCLIGLVRENGTTLIMCTHAGFSPEFADDRYVLRDGKLESA
jgi:putative ABC transport system ATP-binding protein